MSGLLQWFQLTGGLIGTYIGPWASHHEINVVVGVVGFFGALFAVGIGNFGQVFTHWLGMLIVSMFCSILLWILAVPSGVLGKPVEGLAFWGISALGALAVFAGVVSLAGPGHRFTKADPLIAASAAAIGIGLLGGLNQLASAGYPF